MATATGYARSGDQASVSSSLSSSVAMDEAYRRVGHRLSQRVGGDDSSVPLAKESLGGHEQSAFHAHGGHNDDQVVRNSAQLDYDRTAKVAKTEYTDHGTHEKLVAGSILKNLTLRAKETYSTLYQEQSQLATPPGNKAGKKRISPTFSISPHRHALSALALDDKTSQDSSKEPKGLLQAALDVGNSSNSSTSTTPVLNHSKGKCLTQPSKPVSNDGLDNAEGNLIVYENDRISVPAAQVHTLEQGRNQFRVVSLLGQGTFAQVFKCQCLQTGQIVALKVVKNKPAYTRQAAVEIDVFTALAGVENENMVGLQCYFLYHHHLCLVFELLGLNLYEVLKRRQFRGLPLAIVRTLVQQAVEGVKDLTSKNIVHCDLKPENILLSNEEDANAIVNAGEAQRLKGEAQRHKFINKEDLMGSFSGTPTTDDTGRTSSEASTQFESTQKIKLIDFGSACFEGHAAHTYIQSRFYRCPEVLVGVPYDSAIDMWSMGCVAAELFLGLPILPGVNEHDQLRRISEMIGPLPDRMLEQGSKSTKYYVKELSRTPEPKVSSDLPPRTPSPVTSSTPPPPRATWRIKTQEEYIQSLTPNEIRKKGGLAKLQKQPTNRYFKRKKLTDIIMLHGHCTSNPDLETLGLFAHFLMGILDPDPLKRWTAYQASMHPFITGNAPRRRRSDPSKPGSSDKASREFDILWAPPWDPAICRRKLLDVQRTREKQQALRRSLSGGCQPRSPSLGHGGTLHEMSPENYNPLRRGEPASPSLNRPSRAPQAADVMQANLQGAPQIVSRSQSDQVSPPSSVGGRQSYQQVYPGLPQHFVPGMNMNDSHMMSSLPHLSYAGASSLTDFNSGVATDRRTSLPNMMGASSVYAINEAYAEAHAEAQRSYSMIGPQSFTGIYDYHVSHMPFEGDFAYALQRPGIVPGMDLSSSATTMYPQASGLPAYSPRQVLTGHQRSRSFTHSSGGGNSMPRRQRNSYGPKGVPTSPGNHGQSQYMHNSFMGPTSINEDSTDYHLGGSVDTSSYPTRGSDVSSATSLLAQQLEDRSSGQAGPLADSYQDMMYASDSNFHHSSLPPGYVPGPGAPGPGAMYAQTTGQPMSTDSGGYYYTTYMSPDGVVMSAPVNMDMHNAASMQQAALMQSYGSYGSYGSYPDQPMQISYGPPPSLAPQGYPSYITQHSSGDIDQNGGVRRSQRPPPHYHHQGMSM